MTNNGKSTDLIDPDLIDGAFVPAPMDGTVGLELDGEMVLVEEQDLAAHHLNPIATVIWACLDGFATVDELVEDISDVYQTDADIVRRDVIDLMRQLGRAGLLQGVAAARPGPQVPDSLVPGTDVVVTLPDLDGHEVDLTAFQPGRVLLVNWSPACGFCTRIAPDLAALQPALKASGVELVLLALGDAAGNRELLEEAGLEAAVLLRDHELESEPFPGLGTPAAYLLDEQSRVASSLALGADQVPLLARSAAGLTEVEA